MRSKIIVRIKGGLGNQLFCYAAARRLAVVNDAELIIDEVSGFVRDRQYRRRYALDHFHIAGRKATPAERLEPFERYRRAAMKWISRTKPFTERRYIEQEGIDFDERLLALRVQGVLHLDGLWQSEGYFKDVEAIIRDDLRLIPPTDAANQRMSQEIKDGNAVALHIRWFQPPGVTPTHNLSNDYYDKAISIIEREVESPRYFLFSDHPNAACTSLTGAIKRLTPVAHNSDDGSGFADLWLMSQCRHFVIANSTFSWWGAWLARHESKIVVAPNTESYGVTAWGFTGQLPTSWIRL